MTVRLSQLWQGLAESHDWAGMGILIAILLAALCVGLIAITTMSSMRREILMGLSMMAITDGRYGRV